MPAPTDDCATLPTSQPTQPNRPLNGAQTWQLQVLTSPDSTLLGQQIPIGQAGLWLGRRPDREPGLRVDDPAMSRTHVWLGPALPHAPKPKAAETTRQAVRQAVGQSAELPPQAVGLDCHDQRSQNGTFLNGLRETAKTLVAPTVLRVGATVLVVEPGGDGRVPESAATEAVPGQSTSARQLRAALAEAAAAGEPVWLFGESGTGKEFAAAEVHRLSGRTGKLVRLHVPTIAPGEFEAELFGHHGQGRLGRIAEANDGTLLLDAVDELARDLQAKLLRVLEEGVVRPVGGGSDVLVNVQFVATVCTDPQETSTELAVRRDLLARFRNHWIALPPLRHRPADLLAFADRLVPLPNGRLWRETLSATSLELLLVHTWRDNLRELRAVLTRLRPLTTESDLLQPDDLQFVVQSRSMSATDKAGEATRPIRQAQTMPARAELTRLLREHRGNVNAIARALDRDRKQVYRWLTYAQVSEQDLERFRTDESTKT